MADSKKRTTVQLKPEHKAYLAEAAAAESASETDMLNAAVAFWKAAREHNQNGARILARYPDGAEVWLINLESMDWNLGQPAAEHATATDG